MTYFSPTYYSDPIRCCTMSHLILLLQCLKQYPQNHSHINDLIQIIQLIWRALLQVNVEAAWTGSSSWELCYSKWLGFYSLTSLISSHAHRCNTIKEWHLIYHCLVSYWEILNGWKCSASALQVSLNLWVIGGMDTSATDSTISVLLALCLAGQKEPQFHLLTPASIRSGNRQERSRMYFVRSPERSVLKNHVCI